MAFIAVSSDLTLPDDWKRFVAVRAMLVLILPVVVLLCNFVLPASWKARLVFWRWRHALPGCRAFDEGTLSDPRIDRDRLRKNVGAFPVTREEQNRTWYRLFKKVEHEPSITDVNQRYLLLRDLAAMSVLMLIVAIVCALAGWISQTPVAKATAILVVQYLLAALSARRLGNGLVSSVLALHGVKRRV